MSSAILYFAIVAIWAGVLMPKWLRPGASRNRSATVPVAEPAPLPQEEQVRDEDGRLVQSSGDDWALLEEARPVGVPLEEVALEPPSFAAASFTPAGPPVPPVAAAAGEPQPSQAETAATERRASILRARRRMLSTLIIVTLGALTLALTDITPLWVVIPPGLMLGGFVMLLREASRSDRVRARRQAMAQARAARRATAATRPAAARPAPAPRVAEPAAAVVDPDVIVLDAEPEAEETTAQIFDISARVHDQFYDQYADAAVRAVGD